MTRIIVLLSFAFVLSNHQHAQAQASISNAEISFLFVSKDVKGIIEGFESSSTIDFNDLESSSLEGSVAVSTLDTNNGLRNWHLKGKYFKEEDFPKIHFKSTAISKKENDYVVTGNLTLKGVTRPITINFNKQGNKLQGITSIYSFDYGIKIKKKREENLVEITFLFDIN